MYHFFRFSCLLCILAVLALSTQSCSKTVPTLKEMEKLSSYVNQGDYFLANGRIVEAMESFDTALSLNQKYSPAMSGKALALAINANKSDSGGLFEWNRDLNIAQNMFRQASKEAESNEEKARIDVFQIRLNKEIVLGINKFGETEFDLEDVVEEAIDSFEDLRDENKIDAYTSYHMAQLYEAAGNYNEALNLMLGISYPKMSIDMRLYLKRLQRKKAIGSDPFLHHLFKRTEISKAESLEVFEKFFSRKLIDESGEGKDLQKTGRTVNAYPVNQKKKHLRELRSFQYDLDQPLKRFELALILEDLFVAQSKTVKSAHIGESSLFPDVDPSAPFYNAVRVVVTRGLMQTVDLQGKFSPYNNVSGDVLIQVLLKIEEYQQQFRNVI